MCSVIASIVSSFDGKPIDLENIVKANCSVLLIADCTLSSRFAVFIKPLHRESHPDSFELEVHIDDLVLWYTPHMNGKDFIRLQNSTGFEVSSLITPFGETVELR